MVSGYDIGTNAGFLAGVLFSFVPLLLVLFALVEAGAWASDLDAGRIEIVLSTPHSRLRVISERFGAPLIIGLIVLASATAVGSNVDMGHLVAAVLGIVPLEPVTGALVFLSLPRTCHTTCGRYSFRLSGL